MGAGDIVVALEGRAGADGHGLLADVGVGRPPDHVLPVQRHGTFVKVADQPHAVVQVGQVSRLSLDKVPADCHASSVVEPAVDVEGGPGDEGCPVGDQKADCRSDLVRLPKPPQESMAWMSSAWICF